MHGREGEGDRRCLYLSEESGLNEARTPRGEEVEDVVVSASLSSLSSSSIRGCGGSLRGGVCGCRT